MKKTIYTLILIYSFFVLQSCEEILLEDDITDKEVTLVAPVNNAMLNNTSVFFAWENVENATKYRLQVARPDFANPVQIVLDTLVSGNSFNQQLNIGNYQWRVKAVNSGYETVYATRNITVMSNSDFQSNTVTLLTPNNNMVTNVTVQNLMWQPIIGAIGYQVQIIDANSTIISDQTVPATNFNYTFPEGNLQWRVRAMNGIQQTMYTARSILIDTTNPNTPVLTAPVNASTVSNTAINFQWNRTPIAGSVEKDSIYVYTNSGLTDLQFKNQASSPFSITLNVGTYYWYVKTFDQAGNTSSQSSTFNFIVD